MYARSLLRLATQVFILIAVASSSSFAQTPQCTIGGLIPCVVDWYHLTSVPGRTESHGASAWILPDGDTLTTGSSGNATYTDRDLFRFARDGTPKYGFGIEGVPWYIGSSSANDWSGFPWQKFVVDETRGRFFVLFAAVVAGGIQPSFFLAAHDLATGEKLASWGGLSRHVGAGDEFRAAIDIDGNGDVWTVWQVGLHTFVKKWQGSTGTNISPTNLTPPEDYFLIPSPAGAPRRLQAFGARKSDNKLYIAFEEAPHDAVVTLWDSSLQFLGRYNYAKELPAPSSLPSGYGCCYPGDMVDHPYFSDGYVDPQGTFVLAGTYRYRRYSFEFEVFYTYPALVRFNVDAPGTAVQLGSEFFEDQHPSELPYYSAPTRKNVRVVGTPQRETYLQFEEIDRIIYRFSSTPSYMSHVWMPMPFVGSMGPSGCRYFAFPTTTGLYYRDNRLVLAGTVKKLLNPCGGEDPTAFTISYKRQLQFQCCRTSPFDWRRFWQYEWFWHKWQGNLPPPSCPQCRPYARSAPAPSKQIGRLINDVGLVTGTGRSMEFGDKVLDRLASNVESLPAGRHFTAERQKELTSELKAASRGKPLPDRLRASLTELVNAALLDRTFVDAKPAKVDRGRQTVRVDRVLANFSGVDSPGTLELEVRNGLPANLRDADVALPAATFRLKFSGKLAAKSTVELVFDLRDFSLPPRTAALHVLHWDGKVYRDVTAAFNIDGRVASAIVDRLGDFIIAASVVPTTAEGKAK